MKFSFLDLCFGFIVFAADLDKFKFRWLKSAIAIRDRQYVINSFKEQPFYLEGLNINSS